MNAATFTVWIITATALSGCYLTDASVIATGDDIGIRTGRYACAEGTFTVDKKAGSSPQDTIYEIVGPSEKAGKPSSDEARFIRAKGDVLVLEAAMRHPDGARLGSLIAFVKISEQGDIDLLMPKVSDHRVRALATMHQVRVDERVSVSGIEGKGPNILEFVRAHDPTMLEPTGRKPWMSRCSLHH